MFPDRQCVSNLGAELVELSVLMASDDELSQRSPHSTGDLVIAARYRQVGLVVFCRERERERLAHYTTEKYDKDLHHVSCRRILQYFTLSSRTIQRLQQTICINKYLTISPNVLKQSHISYYLRKGNTGMCNHSFTVCSLTGLTRMISNSYNAYLTT